METQAKMYIDNESLISKTDLVGKITYVNERFCALSGYSEEELMGQCHSVIRHPDVSDELFKDLWSTIKKKKPFNKVIKNRKKNGESYYVDTTIIPVINTKGEVEEYISVRHDITDIVHPKKILSDKIGQTKNPILILMQIENYDILVDFYDAQTVEKIEKIFARNLLNFLPKSLSFNKVYQVGNGKFALLDEYTQNDPSTTYYLIKEFAQNIKKSVIGLDNYEYDVSMIVSYSIGYPKYILKNTQIGLKKAREEKKEVLFADRLYHEAQQKAKNNIEVIKKIQKALESNRIISKFQPILNNSTEKIEKFESLVRLVEEDGNEIPPLHFLEVAKKGNYYRQITLAVINNSFEALKQTDKQVSINISSLDIDDGAVRYMLLNSLSYDSDIAKRVTFELLEDEGLKNFESVKEFISIVKEFGAKIAIDDFGSGYSNFERILALEPDILKIDGTLIKNLDKESYNRDIVETINMFAKKRGILTVAEFVSNEDIYRIVRDIGIDYSQGFYIAKPGEINISALKK